MDYIQDRKLKIDLLRDAHDRLHHSCGFICNAIEHAEHVRFNSGDPAERNDVRRAARELDAYVMKAISPQTYYSRWLQVNHPQIYEQCGKNAMQGRLAWINWMIACYEEDIANYKKDTE